MYVINFCSLSRNRYVSLRIRSLWAFGNIISTAWKMAVFHGTTRLGSDTTWRSLLVLFYLKFFIIILFARCHVLLYCAVFVVDEFVVEVDVEDLIFLFLCIAEALSKMSAIFSGYSCHVLRCLYWLKVCFPNTKWILWISVIFFNFCLCQLIATYLG